MKKLDLIKAILKYKETNDWDELMSAVDTYDQALRQPTVISSADYTEHFLEWRNRFFDLDIEIREWKIKNKGTRCTTDELHKRYITAMLQSPFKD